MPEWVCLSVFLCSLCASAGNVPSPNAPLKRVLAYTGCFSRMGTIKDIHLYLSQRLRIKEEDMRLWLYNSEVGGAPFSFIYLAFFFFKHLSADKWHRTSEGWRSWIMLAALKTFIIHHNFSSQPFSKMILPVLTVSVWYNGGPGSTTTTSATI